MSEVGRGNIDALRRAAGEGQPRALAALGKRLLVGEGVPAAPLDGLAMLREAAARGDGEAAALLSVCAAWGVAQARDFSGALDSLERAAELGWEPAQHELRLLARESGNDWPALRGNVDIAAWTVAPAARIVSRQPQIASIEHFASAEECAWIIQRGRLRLQRAMVYQGTSTPRAAETRTNSEMSFTIFNADVVLSLIRERIASATRAPVACFEIAKLLRYEPGQQFALHADFLELNTPELIREVRARGQRAATFLIYLNDDYEGGETDFPRIEVCIKGGRGSALLFSNIDTSGAPDYSTLHAGLPPTRGEKWVLSQWIRTRPVG